MDSCFSYASSPSNRLKSMAICSKVFQVLESGTELEDSRGNKVFKTATTTDQFGVASAEFGLADEVNLGTYHLRALMGDANAPTNTAEIALNVG